MLVKLILNGIDLIKLILKLCNLCFNVLLENQVRNKIQYKILDPTQKLLKIVSSHNQF